jgi:integrase
LPQREEEAARPPHVSRMSARSATRRRIRPLSVSSAPTARGRRGSASCSGRGSSSRPGTASLSRNALRAVHKAGDDTGLNGNGKERVGLHELRHSFVALALDSGATLAEDAVLARHANAKVAGQIYAGVSEKAKAEIGA